MSSIPVVDENTLNNAACGIASATMILDYYTGRTIDIKAVAQYVQENSLGTNTDQLQTGLETASTSPALHVGVPLTASWHTTDNTHWFSVLQAELDAKRPIVLFFADGGTLGWNWHYPHFIVVSGYTNDDSIIYHDPWDGKPHTLPNAAFDGAWGTTWNGNPPWWFMQIAASQTPTPTTSTTVSVPTPTQSLSPTPSPTLSPSPTATSITTPTPTRSPLLLYVNPNSINASQDCSWQNDQMNGQHGGGTWSCAVSLQNLPSAQNSLSWSVSSSGLTSNNSMVSFSQSSGTLAPGQSTTVNFNVSIIYVGSCFGIHQGNFIFSGPFNTVNVPWTCDTPTFTITPVNLTVQKDCQLLSTAEWVCIVTATQNFPGQVIIGGGSNNGNITIEPPGLMLTSPAASSMTGQFDIYLPVTSCPGTFSLNYSAASADSSNIAGSITC